MIKTIAIAVLFGGLAATGAAQAAPLAQKAFDTELGRDSGITLVQRRDREDRRGWDRRGDRHHFRGNRGFRDGPPRGWRRYGSRPWNYRARGCAMFGPVWFCP